MYNLAFSKEMGAQIPGSFTRFKDYESAPVIHLHRTDQHMLQEQLTAYEKGHLPGEDLLLCLLLHYLYRVKLHESTVGIAVDAIPILPPLAKESP